MTDLTPEEIIREHYSRLGKEARKKSPLSSEEAKRRQALSVISRKKNTQERKDKII